MTTNTTNIVPQSIADRIPAGLREKGYVPQITFPGAHWFIRVPLALIIFNQGWMKFTDLVGGAESYGFPVWMWFMAGLGEVLGAAALIVGGAVKAFNPPEGALRLIGDVITRLGGLAITLIVAAVIYLIYWGPWQGMQFHLMLLAGGLFFMWRGNRA
ncbi:MAG: DoxX family membrane protein [Pseudomonadota bacterium]